MWIYENHIQYLNCGIKNGNASDQRSYAEHNLSSSLDAWKQGLQGGRGWERKRKKESLHACLINFHIGVKNSKQNAEWPIWSGDDVSSDFILQVCDNFLSIWGLPCLKPEQRQTIEALHPGRDVLDVFSLSFRNCEALQFILGFTA